MVAPYTGAWIEITLYWYIRGKPLVAPYTGAWIEIIYFSALLPLLLSLPTRERGLKCRWGRRKRRWSNCRSLHGSVD
ncbi:hypothetical protein [Caproicibacterium sp. XB2]|uniref:hypothetical protein n=1 Tax=Caproicibacterium sp. XB2 TaxID=3388458 RepID=UPI00384EC832